MLRAVLATLAAASLSACAEHENRIQVRGVLPEQGPPEVLILHIRLPQQLREGLQRGVALSWRLDLVRSDGRESHWRELRYSPLSRQYQLREPATGYSRSYPSRSAALAALERWPLPPGQPIRSARLRLDTTRLPAPLVLPALFDRDWRLDSGDTRLTTGEDGAAETRSTARGHPATRLARSQAPIDSSGRGTRAPSRAFEQ